MKSTLPGNLSIFHLYVFKAENKAMKCSEAKKREQNRECRVGEVQNVTMQRLCVAIRFADKAVAKSKIITPVSIGCC